MYLLPERAASLEEWRERIYFPGGFQEWAIRMSHPAWSLSSPMLVKPENKGDCQHKRESQAKQ